MTFVLEGRVPRLGRLLNQTKLVQISAASCACRKRDRHRAHIRSGPKFGQERPVTTNAHKKMTFVRSDPTAIAIPLNQCSSSVKLQNLGTDLPR
jgi:hypothetical protein